MHHCVRIIAVGVSAFVGAAFSGPTPARGEDPSWSTETAAKNSGLSLRSIFVRTESADTFSSLLISHHMDPMTAQSTRPIDDLDLDELKLLLMDDQDSEDSNDNRPASSDSIADRLTDKDYFDDGSADDDLKGNDLETDFDSDENQSTDSDAESIQVEAKQRAAERLQKRLAELRKPAWQLDLVSSDKHNELTDEPRNLAAELNQELPVRYLSGSFHPIPLAERVHVPFCHRPTYFQELNLERCGQLDCKCLGCLQNAYSSLWFLTNSTLLPYRLASQSPCKFVGAYGDCPACHRYEHSIEPLGCGRAGGSRCRGLATQAASVAGFAFLAL